MGDYLERDSEPDNPHEPVDSSAAAIACQALLRLGRYLSADSELAKSYHDAGVHTLQTLLGDKYLSQSLDHEGLLLHSVYHRPRGWDHTANGSVPRGESTMWGDYHLLEAALLANRMINDSYYHFFDPLSE